MKKIHFFLVAFLCSISLSNELSAQQDYGVVKDSRDNQVYKTVKIGDQWWMAENLRYTTPGDYVTPNNPHEKYGRLYTWSMAMALDVKYDDIWRQGSDENHQGICPDGWHLPSDKDWRILERYLGMPKMRLKRAVGRGNLGGKDIGGKLKSTEDWEYKGEEGNGTNSSGFNVLPAGYYEEGNLMNFGFGASFWTATEFYEGTAKARGFTYKDGDIYRYNMSKVAHRSCRCVKNN